MRSFLSSLLFASLSFAVLQDKISEASKKVRNGACSLPDQPVVTIGYLLYDFGFTTKGEPTTDIEEWLGIVHKRLGREMSSKLDNWTSGGPTVNPYTVLRHIKDLMGRDSPDIVCLVTQVPLTVYTYGFGSYEQLCGNAVPMFLTYNKTDANDTGDHFGLIIINSLNIFNFYTWDQLSEVKKYEYFSNCSVQRFKQEWF
uniref:Putative lipocalin n=1 Tax=Ixodes ricinus TaxID=34613 RepID=A0A6B0V0U3_IXORI